MKQHIKVNGCKLPIDPLNMDFLKRLVDAQAALQATKAAVGDFPDGDPQKQYEWMDAYVTATCAFFDAVFGTGTAERIFERSNEVSIYWNALLDFGREIEKADKRACRKFK